MGSNESVTSVTFRYRRRPGEGPVLMVAGFVQGGRDERMLLPVPGTDLVERTYELPDDYLGTYLFWVGDEGVELPEPIDELMPFFYSAHGRPLPDPENPDRLVYPVDPEHPGEPFVQSIVRGPASMPEPFVGAPLLGTLSEHRVGERRVWVHESAGTDADGPPPALMVVLDGGVYAHLLHTPEQVDALVSQGEFPPAVTVYCHFVDDAARNDELLCRDGFADFVADELVPWAAGRWRFTTDPARTVVAGSSLGGLSATFLALRRPQRFGNVIAQSPSFWWHPAAPAEHNWMAEVWPQQESTSTRCYVEMGDFEDAQHARRFVDVATHHGNDAVLEHYSGGHDFVCWRATFPRALRWVAAGMPPA
jgi:enterochelin esterase family protein